MFEKDWGLIGRLLWKENKWNMRSLTYLQNEHFKNKQWLFPYFGKDGRIVVDISTEDLLNIEDIVGMISSEANCIFLRDKLINDFGYSIYYSRLMVGEIIHTLTAFVRLFEVKELVANKVEKASVANRFGMIRGVQIGMKVSKLIRLVMESLFKYATDGIDVDTKYFWRLNSAPEWQTYVVRVIANHSIPSTVIEVLIDCISQIFSKVLESFKINNHKLVLSINPVDLLFASDYTEGWVSCYRITKSHGGCATAPFSLLSDKVTAIAYVYGKTLNGRNMKVKDCKLNVKRWRAFVHFTEPDSPNPTIFVGRQYKTGNTAISHKLSEILAHLYTTIYKIDTCQLTMSPSRRVNFTNSEYMYTGDRPTMMLSNPESPELSIPAVGVKDLYCVECGITRINRGELKCSNCDVYTCGVCGKKHPRSDMTFTSGGGVCKQCLSEHPEMVPQVCIHCRMIAQMQQGTMTPHGFMCNTCYTRSYIPCKVCEQLVHVSKATRIDSETVLCEGCFEHWKREGGRVIESLDRVV